MYKILSVGMILLLSTACFPHLSFLPQKTHTDFLTAMEGQPSLFTQSELGKFSPPEPILSQIEISTFSSSPLINGLWVRRLELPISDESSDDFKLEILIPN
ncbi:MAG: hypothetical protein AB1502_02510, partial [Thermodesulfobacteriota bacterium]